MFQERVEGNFGSSGGVVTGLVVVVTGFVVVVIGLVVVVTGFAVVVVVVGAGVVVTGSTVVVASGVVSGVICGVVTGIVEVISGISDDTGGMGVSVNVVDVGTGVDGEGAVVLLSAYSTAQEVRMKATRRSERIAIFFIGKLLSPRCNHEGIGI